MPLVPHNHRLRAAGGVPASFVTETRNAEGRREAGPSKFALCALVVVVECEGDDRRLTSPLAARTAVQERQETRSWSLSPLYDAQAFGVL
jgi:hypothetical protein